MLQHRSLGLGIIIKLTAPWIVGKALRTGKESYRVEIGQSHRTGVKDWAEFYFLRENNMGFGTGRYWLNLDSSLTNGHLWASYFTSLFKKDNNNACLGWVLVRIKPSPKRKCVKQGVCALWQFLFFPCLPFLVSPQPIQPQLSIQCIQQPYIENLLHIWLPEGAASTNRKRHSSYPQVAHSVQRPGHLSK